MYRSLLPALLLASPAFAEVPKVVTDIAPVQGLVASVMGDLGTPEQLVPAGASPHSHALKPSEARALQNADLVFWIGEELSPDLARKIEAIAKEGTAVTLFDLPGTQHFEARNDVLFAEPGAHDEHDHGGHDDHDAQEEAGHDDHEHEHDDHDEHAHDTHDDHDDHGHDAEGHHHEGDDPHAWLSVDNASTWLTAIAETLSKQDPENAETYAANAEAAQTRIAAARASAEELLAPVQGSNFVVFHDAFQYYEKSFGLTVLGAISLSDATAPSPARLDALRDALDGAETACVFAEPQFDPRLIAAVTEGAGTPVAELDPLGTKIAPGADFYPALIEDLAQRIADCAAQ
ncbi:zinc ABC transporter substrate-binding protein [Alloyangia pacifica]|uniref:High-affinity zinc uptake system protein ZnuA n=1 Tax=Alloyangia pacifica TaxID=311180 RepID=A0A1I6TEZ4_9RHOB|nr:zinc ABC transporter substrate-binding protein [Alloyangia pacifica]SDH20378.1 zinc transport system substrate-binding protein [Alloyangia pacifica]SFS87792.1 zinc transport system substrate-binding protein [Alloyangia pacifica]